MLALAAGRQKVDFRWQTAVMPKITVFEYRGEEKVDVEAGHFETLKVARSKNRRPSQASLWLAPKLNHLPVIIEKKEKDGIYLMELSSFSWSGLPSQNR